MCFHIIDNLVCRCSCVLVVFVMRTFAVSTMRPHAMVHVWQEYTKSWTHEGYGRKSTGSTSVWSRSQVNKWYSGKVFGMTWMGDWEAIILHIATPTMELNMTCSRGSPGVKLNLWFTLGIRGFESSEHSMA